jgi:hypothetical protein
LVKKLTEQTKWYQKKELWAVTMFVVGGVKYLAKPHTVAYQVADYSINIGIPLALGFLGVKDGIKNNSLPMGLRKFNK